MHPMRRKDRTMEPEKAKDLLMRGEYGVLSLVDKGDIPYGVPISYAVMEGAIYFHCAREGRKLECLAHQSRVSFCVTENVQPVFDGSFSTYYESVIAEGEAAEVAEREEKLLALRTLCEKYLPEHMDQYEGALATYDHTGVYKIIIESLNGKSKARK